ncbi:LexA regulated protein [Escherichia coli]|uniref:LexA regulated protein n=1 Tax=Escherichia coli TaxID=562 RepID=A0A2X1KVS4_ECOLX|nr:LexA regulated protein [Escherichia coli]
MSRSELIEEMLMQQLAALRSPGHRLNFHFHVAQCAVLLVC